MRAAVAFLTVVGRSRTPDGRTLDWFPLVGAALGLALGGFWWLTGRAWPAAVAAGLVVAADLAVTGLLHVDGLIDSADGLLPPMSRERRLDVMADPGAGAFGVAVAGAVLLLRFAALASLQPAVLLLGGLWCLSRTFIATVARVRPYARTAGGLAGVFQGPVRWGSTGAGMAAAAIMAAFWRVGPGLAAVAVALAAGALVMLLAERRIGGFTGDVLGAGVVISETAGLVVAAARW